LPPHTLPLSTTTTNGHMTTQRTTHGHMTNNLKLHDYLYNSQSHNYSYNPVT